MSDDDTVEPFGVADTFACELVRVERLGCNRRLYFAVPDGSVAGKYKAVVSKLIIPADYMATLAFVIANDGKSPPVAEDLLSAMDPIGKAN